MENIPRRLSPNSTIKLQSISRACSLSISKMREHDNIFYKSDEYFEISLCVVSSFKNVDLSADFVFTFADFFRIVFRNLFRILRIYIFSQYKTSLSGCCSSMGERISWEN